MYKNLVLLLLFTHPLTCKEAFSFNYLTMQAYPLFSSYAHSSSNCLARYSNNMLYMFADSNFAPLASEHRVKKVGSNKAPYQATEDLQSFRLSMLSHL